MIKLVIFDLDGVLVSAKELHYEALNNALKHIDEKYVINRAEHLSTYDGLPTSKKLKMLTQNKGLNEKYYQEIWELKQKETISIINSNMTYDNRMRLILENLKNDGYYICVASNSIRESLKMMLLRKGLLEYVDYYISNQDVKHPKPNSEMYLKCMIKFGVNANETIIVEDSHIGRTAVINSGAHLCAVIDPNDVSYEKIKSTINFIENKDKISPKWQGGKMNVLIPMAGSGSRFAQAGYTFPKPLIEVNGKPMI